MTFYDNDVVLYVFEGVIPKEPERRPGDFLAFMVKRGADGRLEAEYRFRWYNGPSFDSKDDKTFYRIGPVEDLQSTRQTMLSAFRTLLAQTGMTETWEREVNGGVGDLHVAMLDGPLSTQMEVAEYRAIAERES